MQDGRSHYSRATVALFGDAVDGVSVNLVVGNPPSHECPVAKDSKDEKFSEAETQKRFEAALRGARIAGRRPKVVKSKLGRKTKKASK